MLSIQSKTFQNTHILKTVEWNTNFGHLNPVTKKPRLNKKYTRMYSDKNPHF